MRKCIEILIPLGKERAICESHFAFYNKIGVSSKRCFLYRFCRNSIKISRLDCSMGCGFLLTVRFQIPIIDSEKDVLLLIFRIFRFRIFAGFFFQKFVISIDCTFINILAIIFLEFSITYIEHTLFDLADNFYFFKK